MAEQQPTGAGVTVYGTKWCGDCRRSKRTLELLAVPYRWVDVSADEEAQEEAVAISGRHSIPVITFPDGSHLVEPGDRDLLDALIRVGVVPV